MKCALPAELSGIISSLPIPFGILHFTGISLAKKYQSPILGSELFLSNGKSLPLFVARIVVLYFNRNMPQMYKSHYKYDICFMPKDIFEQ